MEEKRQHIWHIMLYYFKKCKTTTEAQKKICSVYEEGVVTERIHQKWFVKFHARAFSLDSLLWLDRPVEVNSNELKTLMRIINVVPVGDSQDTQRIQIKH